MPNTSSNFSAAVNFNLPPIADAKATSEEKDLHNTLWQVINTLITQCGIATYIQQLWAQLQNNPVTLISANLNRFYVLANETINQGAAISLQQVGGKLVAVNANATDNTRVADGFCNLVNGITAGSLGEVILHNGLLTSIDTVFSPGTRYYLGLASGVYTSVRPVAAGNIEQFIGVAITPNQLLANISGFVQH